MPHVGTASTRRDQSTVESVGDDFASTDEVKVYKDEGDDEHRSSENLSEDKLGLVTETEEGSRTSDVDGNSNKNSAKLPDYRLPDHLLFGYPFLSSYPYANCPGLTAPGKLFGHHPGLSLYMYNNDPIVGQPPPAHSGILPLHVDPKTGLPRAAFYGLPPPGRLYGSEFNHLQFDLMAQTNAAAAAAAAAGLFGGPLSNPLSSWFAGGPPPPSAGLLTSHPQPPPGIVHPASSSGPVQDLSLSSTSAATSNEGSRQLRDRTNGDDVLGATHDPPGVSPLWRLPSESSRHFRSQFGMASSSSAGRLERKRAYVKKPLNAFMLFMKEMRQKVIDECTLKESAAINQILGRKWHALDRSEQAKYYDMARKEKELHMQLYPGWSARDNYATHTKKKKLKRDPQRTDSDRITVLGGIDIVCPNMRKCRSRYGVEQQNLWCKICRFDGNSSSTENSLVSSPFPSLNDAADSPPYHSVHSASSLPPDL